MMISIVGGVGLVTNELPLAAQTENTRGRKLEVRILMFKYWEACMTISIISKLENFFCGLKLKLWNKIAKRKYWIRKAARNLAKNYHQEPREDI